MNPLVPLFAVGICFAMQKTGREPSKLMNFFRFILRLPRLPFFVGTQGLIVGMPQQLHGININLEETILVTTKFILQVTNQHIAALQELTIGCHVRKLRIQPRLEIGRQGFRRRFSLKPRHKQTVQFFYFSLTNLFQIVTLQFGRKR